MKTKLINKNQFSNYGKSITEKFMKNLCFSFVAITEVVSLPVISLAGF